MKKLLLTFLFTVSSFYIVFGLEITTSITSGNLAFNQSSTAPVSTFSGKDFTWGMSVFGEEHITDNVVLKAGVHYDPVLRYTTNTLFEYQFSFFKLGVGPFFGVFNTPETIMKSGITSSVRIELPGIIFASLEADSSIGARFVKVGDYIQEKNMITVGYYIPNALCSLNLTTKSFVAKQGSALEVDDSFTEYSFKVDIFQKNVTFKALLSFGYQTLSRTFLNTSTGTTTSNTLNSLVFGTDFTFQITEGISIIANLESTIYSFGYENDSTPLTLPDSGIEQYLFRITTGVTLTL